MTLVHNNQEIIGKVVNQGIGRLSGSGKVQVSGIVFNSGADTGFPNHFHIEVCSFRDSLRFQELILFFKILYPLIKFRKDIFAGKTQLIHRNNIGACRENHRVFKLGLGFSC